MSTTIIVIPCYNEAKRLRRGAFLDYVQAQPDVSFLFVDDGSSDATGAILNDLCQSCPESITCLRLDRNEGKAEAVRRGLLDACARGAKVVGYWDADLATPLSEIVLLRRAMEKESRDVVMGSRVALLGRSVTRKPLRHYLGRAFGTASSLALGLTVYDTQCGAKLFRNTTLTRDVFREPFHSRWAFDVEVLQRYSRGASLQGSRMSAIAAEVPLTRWHDVTGSKIHFRGVLEAAIELAHIWKSRETKVPALKTNRIRSESSGRLNV